MTERVGTGFEPAASRCERETIGTEKSARSAFSLLNSNPLTVRLLTGLVFVASGPVTVLTGFSDRRSGE